MGFVDWWKRWKARLEALVEEYGTIAIVTWFSVFLLTVGGFWMAIEHGYSAAGAAAGTGKLVIAYGLTRATFPVRVAVVLVLTPLIARAWRKVRPPDPPRH